MTDLFDRLAARTLGASVKGATGATGATGGAAVSARPRLPSRFEGSGPAGAALVVEEVAASADGVIAANPLVPPSPGLADRPRREPEPATVVAEPVTARRMMGTDPVAVPGSVEADGVGPRAGEAAHRPGRFGVVDARPSATAPIPPHAADSEVAARAAAPLASPSEPGHRNGPSHDHGPDPEPRALPRVAAAPLHVAAAPASAASPAASQAVPGESAGSDGATIRVSIGRVEVRANLVAAPPPRPAPRAHREDALALGDYLRGKRGGA